MSISVEIKSVLGHTLHLVDVADNSEDVMRDAVISCIQEGKSLNGANLQRVNLAGVNFAGMSYSFTNFDHANLKGALFGGVTAKHANFYDTNFEEAEVTGCYFIRCNFTNTEFHGANLSRTGFNWCNMEEAQTRGALLGTSKVNKYFASAYRYSDTYGFSAYVTEENLILIQAGCRLMTLAEYRSHAHREYSSNRKARETFAILDFFERRAIDMGYIAEYAKRES